MKIVTSPIASLPEEWRTRAAELEAFAPPAAEAFRRAATQLEDALRGSDQSVTLQEAHAIGGYSVDHLQRLVSSGAIANVGRKGKPRVRRSDVPVRPGHVASLRAIGTDPHMSARRREVASVTSRRSS